ncbi:GlsB/YeaQ/YmgE family stress response membrane protein [Nanchangia anserum]|uniref:GlsB/YeaQ/YmgE family stress response membrane protein n=1 Tax=Nanchangia anserum TaxID=2692125 RepID=A0A8I0KW06_9ACTO|nr:GlsB/YeaQ/YmgE family stress response membrane protein [Nanchangia anserum]MBD3689499.1 GlsB/YeaQ/YmgE family stress response membrane protein [Nanchangia anserum]QOX81688.1 GlsB/YeaQ/YmgE family stress response membrane protein [Nanchangia anserum]
MHIIGMIIAGAILGALARLFLRGEQNIGMIWTIILGALGWGIGGWVTGNVLNSGSTVIQWIVGVIVAMVLIAVFVAVRNRGANR